MGIHLPISPSAFDFEGFTETDAVKYKHSTISHNGRSVSKVVQTTKITAYTNFNLPSKTTAGSSRQDGKEYKDFQNSHLEVLRAANESAYPVCEEETICLMTESIKKSSEEDYQRKWTTFLDYVHSKGFTFEDIDKGLVMNFLSHLFHTRRLKPSTISHYLIRLLRV